MNYRIYTIKKSLNNHTIGLLKPIIKPTVLNVGYGKGALRPKKSKQPESEARILAKLTMLINGMSGQQTG